MIDAVSKDRSFSVLLTGKLLPNFVGAEVVTRLAQLFNQTPEQIEWLLGSAPCVVRKGVNQATAYKLAEDIARAGARSEVQAEPESRQPHGDHSTVQSESPPDPIASVPKRTEHHPIVIARAADQIEQRFLFSTTRIAALAVISLVLLTLVGVTAWTVTKSINVVGGEVTPTEVIAQLASPKGERASIADGKEVVDWLAMYRIPAALQTFLEKSNSTVPDILHRLLNDVPAGRRQEYINELARAIEAAESAGLDAWKAFRAYALLKEKRLADEVRQKEAAAQARIYLASTAVGTLGLLALFSLVLVLLAIERNTRATGGPEVSRIT